jgi:anti-sigma factor RsiW
MARWVSTVVDRPEACAEWRDHLADWLMATISPDREAALDAHLATCTACRAEAEVLLDVAAVALSADPDVPSDRSVEPSPPLLGQKIERRIRSERRSRTARRALVAAVGASAATAVLVVALVVAGDDGPGKLHGAEFAFRTLPAGVQAEAVVADDDSSGSVVQLVAKGLDPTVTYALWLTPPGGTYPDRVAAGTFRPDGDGTVDVRLRSPINPDKVGRVWATDAHGVVIDTN